MSPVKNPEAARIDIPGKPWAAGHAARERVRERERERERGREYQESATRRAGVGAAYLARPAFSFRWRAIGIETLGGEQECPRSLALIDSWEFHQ